jgi:putative membrane protein
MFSLTALLSIASGACLAAETPPTQSPADKTAPSAASSPHQRDATATGAAEAPSSQSDPAAAATPTPHQKQVTQAGEAAGQAGKSVTPQSFVSQAGVIGKAEVELGQIALKNTQDENVRKYAERMVKDHGAADKKLKAIAAKENLQAPQALDPEHESLKMKLQGMTGPQFDREYMKAMAKGHEKAVALFEAASQQPQMPAELKQFAASTLPVLEQHKEMAHSMHER